MAQGFDKNKATSDLKQMLNLSNVVSMKQDTSPIILKEESLVKAKRKNKNKKDNAHKEQYDDSKPRQSQSVTPLNTKDISNSNGNALLSAHNVNSEWSPATQEKTQSVKSDDLARGNTNIIDSASTPENSNAQKKSRSSANAKKSASSSNKNNSSPTPVKRDNSNDGVSRKPNPKNNNTMDLAQESNSKVKDSDENGPPKPGENEKYSDFLIKLEQHKIHPLKKKNPRFPKAFFYCRLCDYHLNREEDCEKHMEENRHCRRKTINESDVILRSLPKPTGPQLEAITAAVERTSAEHSISSEEKEERASIVARLETVLQSHIPDVILNMYGSSLTRMGFKTADINVDLTSSDKDKKLTFLLKEVYDLMKELTDVGFHEVQNDFSATIPALLMKDTKTGLQLNITIHCYTALCTSELLAIYTEFDDRIHQLAVAFRYWANLCDLDRRCDGFMPPVALCIMVVYFLQNVQPAVAPIIAPLKVSGEDRGDYSTDGPKFKKLMKKALEKREQMKNQMSCGELWHLLLKFYSIEYDTAGSVISIRADEKVSRSAKHWNSKKLAVEDPYLLKRNLTRLVNNSKIYEYWQDSIRKAFHYFALPRDDSGKSFLSDKVLEILTSKSDNSVKTDKEVQKLTREKEENSTTPQTELNVDSDEEEMVTILPNPLIRQSSLEKDSEDEVENLTKSTQKMSISDDNDATPVLTTSEEVISQIVSSGDRECTEQKTDQIRSETSDNVDSKSSPKCQCSNADLFPVASHERDKDASQSDNCLQCNTSTSHGDVPQHSSPSVPDSVKDEKSTKESNENPDCSKNTSKLDISSLKLICVYKFNQQVFTDGKRPTLICTSCEKEGHLKNSCPEDELPEILPLPSFTPTHHKELDQTLLKLPAEVGLSKDRTMEREYILKDLEDFIRREFPDALLCLFGSSCNGFGFDKSDMDISMTFYNVDGENLNNKGHLIERLARHLKQYPGLARVEPILTAKVPIVKFTYRRNELEGDISLYNTLAQQNTKLLLCYSKIDPRVKALGYAVKTFAKVCDIGDASRGSLSSYAYILMMLYYLQQVKPAVIPVLQELYTTEKKPVNMVEGSNAWFMDDLSKLKSLWPEMGQNKMTVAELWIGFLRFYVEDFNYKEFVICIRQKAILTRFEKLWNGPCVAIEDPFDLSHNLGSGLTRTMNNFILKTFIKGRMLYGSPFDENLELFNKYKTSSDYFFDPELLSENRPQNVRGCRACGKIGHMVRDCPIAKKDRGEEHRQQQQQQQQQMPKQQQQRMNQQQQMHHQQQNNYQKQQQHPQHHYQSHQMHHRDSYSNKSFSRREDKHHPGHSSNMDAGRMPPHGSMQFHNLTNNPKLQHVVPSQVHGTNHSQNWLQQQNLRFQSPNAFPNMGKMSPRPLMQFPHSHSPQYPMGNPGMRPGSGSHNMGNSYGRNGQMQSPGNMHHQGNQFGNMPRGGPPGISRMNPVVQNLFAFGPGQIPDQGNMPQKNQRNK